MNVEEMKEHVVHKLRLLATLYYDRSGAFNLLAKRVSVWEDPAEGTDEVSFITSPHEKYIRFEALLNDQFRSRCANCKPLSLSVLRGALDDSPPQPRSLVGHNNPHPDTLDSIESRRFPGVNYRGYLGLWPSN